ncbi:MAG: serine/threonine-protein kinase [Gemmatimonadota bacterium]|nr:serine/threonine-protein kinase [Gemmatimonadota bacterium]
MNGNVSSRIERVVDAILTHPEEEWERVITEECGTDEELAREVRSILERSARSDSYLRELAARVGLPSGGPPGPDLVGRTIGPYELKRLLGRGGMGAVYLVEREEEGFQVRAALKLVATGLPSDLARRRFLHERRLLSRLDHPHIARLFDGGVTTDGSPYFVMEYVDGRPLGEYCDSLGLSVRERIGIALQVCDAVRHAHENLVIHRDLKPENILVTESGDVKLLDFGIARALDADPDGFQTATSAPHPMTWAYASPEQIRGLTLTTASDVYALGVLLYRLVTGRHPYPISRTSLPETMRTVCETPAEPPHVVLDRTPEAFVGAPPVGEQVTAEEIAHRRGVGVSRLRRILAGDIGLVLLTALRKEPQRRYHSVAALAEDLRRFLEGRPVSARPDSTAYRIRRWVARHRGATAAAAVITLLGASLGGLGVRYTAETHAQAQLIARETATTQEIFTFLLDILRLGDPAAGRGDTLTVRAALDRGVARQRETLTGRPELRARLLDTFGHAYHGLGFDVEATALFLEALALRPETGAPGDTLVAHTLGDLARAFQDRGRYVDAFSYWRQALDLLSRVGADSALLAGPMMGMAMTLNLDGHPDTARALGGRAVAVLRRHAGDADLRTLQASSEHARILRAGGEVDSAVALSRGILVHIEDGDEEGAPLAATVLNNLGYYLKLQGDLAGAEESYRRVLSDYDRWVPPSEHAQVLGNLTNVLNAQGDSAGALEVAGERLAFSRRAWPDGGWRVGQAALFLATVHLEYGNVGESIEPLREAATSFRDALGPSHGWTGNAESLLGASLAGTGRSDEAEGHLLRGYRVLLAGPGPDDPLTANAARRLAAFYQDRGRPDEAARYLSPAAGSR